MNFEVTKEEQAKILKWEHCDDDAGAIGGKLTYEFTPNGVGISFIVKCGICKEELDLTDYENW
jgi:hypothetical protein